VGAVESSNRDHDFIRAKGLFRRLYLGILTIWVVFKEIGLFVLFERVRVRVSEGNTSIPHPHPYPRPHSQGSRLFLRVGGGGLIFFGRHSLSAAEILVDR
jgi:hypothetical protein